MFDLSPRILSSEVLLQDILAAVLRQFAGPLLKRAGGYALHRWVVRQLLKIQSPLPRKPGARTGDLKAVS